MYTITVYSTCAHQTSLQYRCTQNQFTVQMYIEPVYSTGVHKTSLHQLSHHYDQRRLKYTKILQHDKSKTGIGGSDFIFHIKTFTIITFYTKHSFMVKIIGLLSDQVLCNSCFDLGNWLDSDTDLNINHCSSISGKVPTVYRNLILSKLSSSPGTHLNPTSTLKN